MVMVIKYLFYIVLILFIYRTLFRPKILIEHRHVHDKKPDDKKKPNTNKLGDYTDYEEVK
jgi:uncharacterized membrane protein YfcA